MIPVFKPHATNALYAQLSEGDLPEWVADRARRDSFFLVADYYGRVHLACDHSFSNGGVKRWTAPAGVKVDPPSCPEKYKHAGVHFDKDNPLLWDEKDPERVQSVHPRKL